MRQNRISGALAGLSATVACDSGQENQEGASESQVSAPVIPSYPSDIDWHSIDYSPMYDPLALPTAAEMIQGFVKDAAENANPPDYSVYF